MRFPGDSLAINISLPRMVLSMVVLAFTLYMVPGLWGAPSQPYYVLLDPANEEILVNPIGADYDPKSY